MRGLYIHIPFCNSLCSYCDFPKIIAKDDIKEKYINRLILELKSYKNYYDSIDTIFIGGGTPNSLSFDMLEMLFDALDELIDFNKIKEFTIELNPENVDLKLAQLLKKHHVNRISMGAQTINEDVLKLLNRHHKKEDILKAIKIFNSVGITNINLDFMFGMPNTNIEMVKEDLKFIKELDLCHVSYYCLIVEENTKLNTLINKGEIKPLDDDLESDIYYFIADEMKKMGYHHYEISNFAKNGYESIHNLKYWNTLEYIGVGAGASGYLDHKRYDNFRSVFKYLKDFKEESYEINLHDSKEEFFMMGLRKVDGVSIKEYKNRFNSDPLLDFNLKKFLNNNLIIIDDDNIRIASDKLFISNLVFEEFVGE